MQLEMDFGNTKVCGKCKETKDRREFYKDKMAKDGLAWQCKSCSNARTTAHHRKNTRHNTLVGPPDRNGTKRCPDCGETKQKTEFTVSKCNIGGLSCYCRSCTRRSNNQWKKDNPARHRAHSARRRARKLKATPKWEDKNKTLWYYDESQRISQETGEAHHVDHRVPLIHWSVRGLHWHGNFDVLPGAENSSKGNRFWTNDWHDYYHEFYDEFLALKEYALSLRKRTNRAPAAKAPTGTATTKPKVSASASPATRASGMTQRTTYVAQQEIQQI